MDAPDTPHAMAPTGLVTPYSSLAIFPKAPVMPFHRSELVSL